MISCELLPHQKAAAQKLKGLRVGALFMEMGTGKTVTAMELIRQRWDKIDKVVYFTPVNLKLSVKYEFARHAPSLKVLV
ncbi:MAG: DEAD/DEAH box helicase family protein, partial [Sphaerochaetaceae bacterium]